MVHTNLEHAQHFEKSERCGQPCIQLLKMCGSKESSRNKVHGNGEGSDVLSKSKHTFIYLVDDIQNFFVRERDRDTPDR